MRVIRIAGTVLAIAVAVAVVLAAFGWWPGESIEREIHTDGGPPIRGKGRATLTKSGDKIKVRITGLSLGIQHLGVGVRITGFRVGLLGPNRRAGRSGADYGKRIPIDHTWESGGEFKPGTLRGTFAAEPGAAIEDYEACLMILTKINDGAEGMILAHTAEPAAHRDFFRLRKPKARPPAGPELARLKKEFEETIARVSQPYVELKEEYRGALVRFEEKFLESSDLEAALAAREEAEAIGRNETIDLESHPQLEKRQGEFIEACLRFQAEAMPQVTTLLDSHRARLKELQAELAGAGDRVEAKAAAREAAALQALIAEPDKIPRRFGLPGFSRPDPD